MSSISNVNKKMAAKNQADELKNLREHHQNEIERLNIKHKENKAKVNTNHRAQLLSLKSENDRKVIEKTIENEQVLQKLDQSIKNVLSRTDKEKENIEKMHQTKLETQKELFNIDYNQEKQKQIAKIQDIGHDSRIQQEKLQRKYKIEENNLKQQHRSKQNNLKNAHLLKVDYSKDQYDSKERTLKEKHEMKVDYMQSQNEKELVRAEREFQQKSLQKNDLYNKNLEKVEQLGQKKIQQGQSRFEEKYEKQMRRDEFVLQQLTRNKEKILNNLKGMLKKEVTVELNKEKDPFYQYKKVDHKLTTNEDNNGYTLSIPTDEFNANKFQLTANDRELKLTLSRDYNFNKKDENGNSNTVKKFESYTKKIPVERIVDAKSITKTYEDGILKFEIEFA